MPVTFPLSDAEIRERLAAASFDLRPGAREALRELFGAVFEDAPSDGNQYAREDGAWSLVTSGLPPDGDYGEVVISAGIWLIDAAISDLNPATSNVDFNQQEAQSLVIENRISDPASPVDGQIWLRVDL